MKRILKRVFLILIISRCFSGIDEARTSGAWNPNGANAFVGLINYLTNSSEKFEWVATKRSGGSFSSIKRSIRINKSVQDVEFISLPYDRGILARKLSEIILVAGLMFKVTSRHYEFIYVDRENLFVGAVLARLGYPVVVRVLGMYSSTKCALLSNSLSGKFSRWLYRSNFKMIICTRDGSAGGSFLEMFRSNKTQLLEMLNGRSEKPSRTKPLNILHSENKKNLSELVIGVFGRIEPTKGTDQLLMLIKDIDSIISDESFRVNFLFFGYGTEIQKLESFRKEIRNINIQYLGPYQYSDLNTLKEGIDFAVSFNREGAISNTIVDLTMNQIPVVLGTYKKSAPWVELEGRKFWGCLTHSFFELEPEGGTGKDRALEFVSILRRYDATTFSKQAENALQVVEEKFSSWEQRIASELDLIRLTL